MSECVNEYFSLAIICCRLKCFGMILKWAIDTNFEALYFEKCPRLHANTKKTSNGVNFNPKQQVTIKH